MHYASLLRFICILDNSNLQQEVLDYNVFHFTGGVYCIVYILYSKRFELIGLGLKVCVE